MHGALCVAYSGQCLTSEALGRRSANRGECAQACRMPYDLIVDGALQDLGDRRYLLSPQDLAAVHEIPDLVSRGVVSFKIEGRLKSPEYVAAVTSVYRKALDAVRDQRPDPVTPDDRYRLEMTFSRGLSTGWVHGVNHQELVGARFGKKRGPFLGRVAFCSDDSVELESLAAPAKPGDGVVFDTGGNPDREQGGRIYEVSGPRLSFQNGKLDYSAIPPGTRVWKTSDPALDQELRKSFAGRISQPANKKRELDFVVTGSAGAPLEILCGGHQVASAMPLEPARTRPLTTELLAAQLGKLGETPFAPGHISNHVVGDVILPLSELNRLRRDLVAKILARDPRPRVSLESILPAPATSEPSARPHLQALCRSHEQLTAALECGIDEVVVDFEDIRRYKEAVATVRAHGNAEIFLATPRIQKAGEEGFFKLIENAGPDGVLIRNVGGISHFAGSPLRRLGDFSLNVANPATAAVFRRLGLERLTISHDLNAPQILDLLRSAPPEWFDLTLHHHMPMFHMEHCVFAAFMSEGTDYSNCGRPCESHRVHLRDRVGMQHPLRADVGCRNTLFHAVPQSGASFYPAFREAGLTRFRVELLEESGEAARRVLGAYLALLDGTSSPADLWRSLHARDQIGVTRGTYE